MTSFFVREGQGSKASPIFCQQLSKLPLTASWLVPPIKRRHSGRFYLHKAILSILWCFKPRTPVTNKQIELKLTSNA